MLTFVSFSFYFDSISSRVLLDILHVYLCYKVYNVNMHGVSVRALRENAFVNFTKIF